MSEMPSNLRPGPFRVLELPIANVIRVSLDASPTACAELAEVLVQGRA
jgi:hypothetical protein